MAVTGEKLHIAVQRQKPQNLPCAKHGRYEKQERPHQRGLSCFPVQMRKSSSVSLDVSSFTGRGGTRLKGSYLNRVQWNSAATTPFRRQTTSRSLMAFPRWQ